MSKPANHACFEASAADVLSRLYESFPEPLDLDHGHLFEAATAAGKIPAHCVRGYETGQTLYGATLRFLEREGLIFITDDRPLDSDGVTLTSKGFVILNKPLDLLKSAEPRTLGSRLGEAVGKEAVGAAVGSVIAALVKGVGG